MLAKKIVIAAALLLTAGIAEAGVAAALPESAMVSLVFAMLGAVGLVVARQRKAPAAD